jgi:biotin transport system substrate-specific component
MQPLSYVAKDAQYFSGDKKMYTTMADIARPSIKRYALAYDIALVISASWLIALCAQIAIPLPFSPVPVTMQTCAVLLIGALLGSQRGSAAALAYIAQGAVGLPVFAGGTAGPIRLLGPTGGYLLGFVCAAFVTGMLAERGWDRHIAATLVAMALGNGIIYAFGVLWLAAFVGIPTAFAMGLAPFVIGDILKIALATLLLPAGWKLLGLQ